MNVALPNTGRRPGASGFIPLLVALALIGIAALGAAVLDGKGAGDAADQPRPVPAPVAQRTIQSGPLLVLYLVDSDAQEEMVRTGEMLAANDRFSMNIPEPDQNVVIMRATTPEDDRTIADVLQNWTDSGSTFQIIDYRGK